MISVVLAEPNQEIATHIGELVSKSADISLHSKARDLGSLKSSIDASDWNLCLVSLAYPYDSIKEFIISANLAHPDGKILLLSDRSDNEQILDFLSLGASGFVEYVDIDRFIIKAISKVWEGEAWIPRSMVKLILDRLTWLNGISGTNSTKVQ
ncbi:MAG: hypothetical protein OEW89_04965 [Gammaproteobacteria bacterium]|nr:hypothetical protein [Gammaproteobacteria bacterium]MDH5592879.1 hypothetical protein [Gammaproteobacteria bacterium]MDH5614831.1 hypothetical protein [Gammaproteobacteria bacterium]